MLLTQRDTYEDLIADFRWDLPDRFNIGTAISDDWARKDQNRICLEHFNPDGYHLALTYQQLTDQSNALASSMANLRLQPGDRIAILLPQSFETVIAHAAIYKLGAIALPLALLFGPDALAYRLKDAGVTAIFTNEFGYQKLRPITKQLPDLKHVIMIGSIAENSLPFEQLIATGTPHFAAAETTPDDPAMMIYTSGTTGPPKGALHGHRVLLGHLPGIQMAHEFMPQAGDKFWTPSDWAWAGGLLNCLLPGLFLGVPVVSSPAQKFDADMAFRIMVDMKVRNAFIPPTALRLMKSVENPLKKYNLNLRTLGSAGESLGRETYDWVRNTLNMSVNEFYGQTECNFVLSNMAGLGVSRSGSMGKPVAGHQVCILNEDGSVAEPGQIGQVAVKRPDPVMFIKYWNNDQATDAKFIGDWMLTGDQGVTDKDGFFEFFGRNDDVITSSGYRIGPGEIEDCLLAHPAVQLAAAVGKPDPLRTEIVKAYVVLVHGVPRSEETVNALRNWVKTRLSMHEYPREIEFIDELPLTTTGKVIRRHLREMAAMDMPKD